MDLLVGQRVLLSTAHMRLPAGRKLGQFWLGPFVIVGRVGPVAYRLDLPKTLFIHPVFYISLLREYRDPGDSREPGAPDPLWYMDH